MFYLLIVPLGDGKVVDNIISKGGRVDLLVVVLGDWS